MGLFGPAWMSTTEDKALAAAKKIAAPGAMDKDKQLRELEVIAVKAPLAAVRQVAVSKLDNDRILAQVVEHDTDSAVREAAVHRMVEYIMIGPDWSYGSMISSLKSVAGDKPFVDAALRTRISDEERLSRILNAVSDQTCLASVAENGCTPVIRMLALLRLKDNRIGAQIVGKDLSFWRSFNQLCIRTDVKDQLVDYSAAHNWNHCVCRRCGEHRDWDPQIGNTHDWDHCTCRVCGQHRDRSEYNSDIHVWQYCTCQVCGKHQALNHHWQSDPVSCQWLVCSACGNTKQGEAHQWADSASDCTRTCKKCGQVEEHHKWYGCTCRICGRKSGNHFWKPLGAQRGYRSLCSVCGLVSDLPYDCHSTHSMEYLDSEHFKCKDCGYVGQRDRTIRL